MVLFSLNIAHKTQTNTNVSGVKKHIIVLHCIHKRIFILKNFNEPNISAPQF